MATIARIALDEPYYGQSGELYYSAELSGIACRTPDGSVHKVDDGCCDEATAERTIEALYGTGGSPWHLRWERE